MTYDEFINDLGETELTLESALDTLLEVASAFDHIEQTNSISKLSIESAYDHMPDKFKKAYVLNGFTQLPSQHCLTVTLEQAGATKKGLIRKVSEAILAFFRKVGEWVKGLFSKSKSKKDVESQTKTNTAVIKALPPPALEAAISGTPKVALLETVRGLNGKEGAVAILEELEKKQSDNSFELDPVMKKIGTLLQVDNLDFNTFKNIVSENKAIDGNLLKQAEEAVELIEPDSELAKKLMGWISNADGFYNYANAKVNILGATIKESSTDMTAIKEDELRLRLARAFKGSSGTRDLADYIIEKFPDFDFRTIRGTELAKRKFVEWSTKAPEEAFFDKPFDVYGRFEKLIERFEKMVNAQDKPNVSLGIIREYHNAVGVLRKEINAFTVCVRHAAKLQNAYASVIF